MQRRLLAAPLLRDGPTWRWDGERLAAELETGGARVLLLVNPQNPTGRVFTRAELEALAELAARHDLIVISDEIHAELSHGQPHIPFASLSADTASRTVTITSATKAFNIAGLRTAVAHVGSAALRAAWDSLPPDLLGAVNVLGVEATRAAWLHGDAWLSAARDHLRQQRDLVSERLGNRPDLGYCPPEATYLAWLDFARVDSTDLAAAPGRYLRQHAGVELSDGADFGSGWESFARLNFATSRPVLGEILDRIEAALPPRPE
jgi:cystathionine beta-lyase